MVESQPSKLLVASSILVSRSIPSLDFSLRRSPGRIDNCAQRSVRPSADTLLRQRGVPIPARRSFVVKRSLSGHTSGVAPQSSRRTRSRFR